MVRARFSFITIALVLSGCSAHPQLIATPIEVKVPVPTPIYCSVPKLAKPALPIAALKEDSAPADTIREYAATVALLKGAVEERDDALAGCVPPANSQTSVAAPSSGESAGANGDAQ